MPQFEPATAERHRSPWVRAMDGSVRKRNESAPFRGSDAAQDAPPRKSKRHDSHADGDVAGTAAHAQSNQPETQAQPARQMRRGPPPGWVPREKVQQQKRRPLQGCTLAPTNYDVRGGLRVVRPYLHRFDVFCKQRWLGRQLIDAVETEWAAFGRAHFLRAIELGLVLVNGVSVAPEYVLKNRDQISHLAHRHEPPVAGREIEILFDGTGAGAGAGGAGGAGAGGAGARDGGLGLVVVDKPATVPVHPCGSYFHNSVVSILGAHHEHLRDVKAIHRLDRLTSGVLLLAKNGATVKAVSEMLKSGGGVEKVYYARVAGRFPATPWDTAFAAASERLLEIDCAWLSLEWLTREESYSAGDVFGDEHGGATGGESGGGGGGGGGAGADADGDGGGSGGDACGDARDDFEDNQAGGGGSGGGGGGGGEGGRNTDGALIGAATTATTPADGDQTAVARDVQHQHQHQHHQLRFSCPLKRVDPAKSQHGCHPEGKEVRT